MPRPSHSSRFYYPKNSGWGVQIIELRIKHHFIRSVTNSWKFIKPLFHIPKLTARQI
jgi:hypothetical protein